MKNSERPGKWKRYLILVLLLAAVCIGGVELLVCYSQAPEVYAAITAPVRAAAQRMGEAGEAIWSGLRRQADAAVAQGAAQIRAGIRYLDELFTWGPPAPTTTRPTRPGRSSPTAPTPSAATAAAPR